MILRAADHAPGVHRCERHAIHAQPAGGAGDGHASVYRQPGFTRRREPGAARLPPDIGDGRDLDPFLGEGQRAAVAAIVGGDDHGPAARLHAIPRDVGMRGVRQHDPWAVVLREGQRPLHRPRREHDLARPHLPQPLPWEVRVGRGLMVRDALDEPDVVVRVVAERGRARQQRHPLVGREFGQRLGDPDAGRASRDGGRGIGEQRAAHLCLLVAEDDAAARFGGGECGGEPGWPRADHQHVAMGMALQVAVGVGRGRHSPETGGAPDHRLIDAVPEAARPHEGLVVEAGGEQR